MFAFMKPKSPVIHVAHSMRMFFGLSGLGTDFQNKQIAFVGNRAQGRFPIPFILQPTNSWTWITANILQETSRFKAYYKVGHRGMGSQAYRGLFTKIACIVDVSGQVLSKPRRTVPPAHALEKGGWPY
jgi:hypothetical protein